LALQPRCADGGAVQLLAGGLQPSPGPSASDRDRAVGRERPDEVVEVPAMTASSPALLTDDRPNGLWRVLPFAPFSVVVHHCSIRSGPVPARVTSVTEPDRDLKACVIAMPSASPETHLFRLYLVLGPDREPKREAVGVRDAIRHCDEEARLRGEHHAGADGDTDLIVGGAAPPWVGVGSLPHWGLG